MKEHSLIVLSILVLSACHTSLNQPIDRQVGMSAQVEMPEASAGRSGMAHRCAVPISRRPMWWRDGAVGLHFGCATAHNAAVQNTSHEPAAVAGTDSIIAVSGVLRYRKGEVEPLREPSVEVGASGGGR